MSNNVIDNYELARDEIFFQLDIRHQVGECYWIENYTDVYWYIDIPSDRRQNLRVRYITSNYIRSTWIPKNKHSGYWWEGDYFVVRDWISVYPAPAMSRYYVFSRENEVENYEELERLLRRERSETDVLSGTMEEG